MFYSFQLGQRVRHRDLWTTRLEGEIILMVPGNGSFPWYFVRWSDGSEDRYREEELTAT